MQARVGRAGEQGRIDMAFMEAEITERKHWLTVDWDGVDHVPNELFDVRVARRVLHAADSTRARRFWAELWPAVRDYVEQRFSVERRHAEDATWVPATKLTLGYGVRLSAPGYLDCTEWEVYASKRDAIKRANELESEEN
jgi:hypothetical protein